MAVAEPAWKKFLKLKSDVPVAAANIADDASTRQLKRKREPLPEPKRSVLKKRATAEDVVEKKAKANKQKKKAKTKGENIARLLHVPLVLTTLLGRRSKKDEADSRAAQSSALQYLSLYCSAPSEWKFSKPRQNYLVKHTYNDEIISDERFPSLLKYLGGLQGGSRERCLETARGLVNRHEREEASGESRDEDDEGKTLDKEVEDEDDIGEQEQVEPVTDDQLERAKQVLETLKGTEEE